MHTFRSHDEDRLGRVEERDPEPDGGDPEPLRFRRKTRVVHMGIVPQRGPVRCGNAASGLPFAVAGLAKEKEWVQTPCVCSALSRQLRG